MKRFLSQLKKPAVRAAQLFLIFGTAFLVLLYFLGAYDLSFLDRYKLLDDNRTNSGGNVFSDALQGLMDDEAGSEPSAETAPDGESTAESETGTQISYKTSAAKAFSEIYLEDKPAGIMSAESLRESGFIPADDTYDYVPGESQLARMTFSFQLPETYSLRKRLTTRNTVVYPEDDSEKYIETKQFREERPAIELYMGYILMDDGSDVFVIRSDGTPLCRYNVKRYEPAYVRDSEDRPLFLRVNDDGTTSYFHLSEDGSQFMISDYDPKTDGRGLRFDYPSDYGKSDSTNIITTYSAELDRFGYLTADENGNSTGVLASYRYTSAFPFTNGLGAVTTTANRGGMFFLNESGREAFDACFMYLSEHDRYTIENLMLPLTDGIESIGFYYFDHGLTRVRRQKIDNWNWVMRGLVRVVSDVDCLIRPDGSEYDLPAGYTLEGYSDGCILLSKNDTFGFMDYTGEWIAQPIYTDAIPFVNGLAALKTADGRWGMIDTLGNIVLPFTYDSVSQVSGGLVAAYREENGWTVFRMMKPVPEETAETEPAENVSDEGVIETPAGQE